MAVTKKKKDKSVRQGNVYIQATFNNTIITITDLNGNTISWCSSGAKGYRGAKKSTSFAAQTVMEDAIRKAKDYGLSEVNVFVKGPGTGRETAIRAIGRENVRVLTIKDTTPIPHNGCRPRKTRRL